MRFGVGIDASLGLSFAERGVLVRAAIERGYESAWTPSGPPTRDGFQVCARWADETANRDRFELGIAVVPVPLWRIASLVSQAGSVGDLSGGRFILGIGAGGIYSDEYRHSFGLPAWPAVAMMRDYTTVLRRLLAGEKVTYSGKTLTVDSLQLTAQPLDVPIYLAALGPQVLGLTGELADGVCLNWSTPDQRSWCRARIAEGAARVGRQPSEVEVMEYVRVCIDDDEEVARRAFTRAFMGYALARPGASKEHGYRGHFTRMGFDEPLSAIEEMRDSGAASDQLVEAFPVDVLKQVGYFGRPEGAAGAFRELARGLDRAVVRIIPASSGLAPAIRTMEACAQE